MIAAGSAAPEQPVAWVKGHGTENDFVLVADPEGRLGDRLDADFVRAICHRRRGVGADGLLRVVRSAAAPDARPYASDAEWFMDFRNADGSAGEMCGNGVRVFARFLISEGLLDGAPGRVPDEIPVATRAGIRLVRPSADGAMFTVDMGTVAFPAGGGRLRVRAGEREWPATAVNVGNPHAVVFVRDVAEAGDLARSPRWEPVDVFPEGTNIEFVRRAGEGRLGMRVYERGVGETRSCGTGAAAVAATAAREDGADVPWTYLVDVPGGTLRIDARADGAVQMTGPAVLRARGSFAP